jgi:O-acetyl-ADP-ribose deacetylase (regulator of RNase III)
MNTKDFPAVIAARKAANAKLAFYNEMMNGPSTMKTIKGDLLTLAEQGEFDIIVQGCNCFNTMGSGIARQIREQYPQAYTADCATLSGDYLKLGTFTWAATESFILINAYTQYDFSRGSDVFEYTSFKLILQKLAHEWPNSRYGFPKIGCGLAGGDEDRILAMLEDFAKTISRSGGTVTLVEFQP